MLLEDTLSYFFIYAFLGWCTEVVYAAVESGEFVNRGFLNGPWCPIYGVGLLLVLYILQPVQGDMAFLFIGSVLITSVTELAGGFVLEKIFHHRWWDYSDMPFNIGGYICPMFSLTWGVGCLVVVDRVHPLIVKMVDWIPLMAVSILLGILAVLFTIDLIATAQSIFRLNKKLAVIDDLSCRIREVSDSIGGNLATGAIAVVHTRATIGEQIETQKEMLEEDLADMKRAQKRALEHHKQALRELGQANRELLDATSLRHIRLLKAFPSWRSIDHTESLDKLKHALRHGITTVLDRESGEKEPVD